MTKIVQVAELSEIEYQCMCLDTTRGGCGITTAIQKSSFTHLAAACQFFPAVGQALLDMGWSKDEVERSINFSGVDQCLNKLQERRIFLATDGSIHPAAPASPMSGSSIVWGQARKCIMLS